ncbi:MAG: hypothetical protein LBD20_00835, partial [Spirochaetaceae bacterium]|nr:hypothetical protein [Spirochaetaceae bacterium]
MKQFISLALGVLVLAGGCAKKSAVRTRAAGEDSHGVYNAAALGGEWANEEAVLQAFTLDYRPQMPEGAAADGSGKKAPDTGGSAAAGGGRRVAGGGGQVVGGGLRKLSDYKTAYYNPQEETERVAAIRAAQAAALEGTVDAGAMGAGSLSVVDWGPRGEYSAQNKNPSVYVVFNRPVVPLSALGAPSDSSPVFSITPKTRGVFRWYGTAFLSFEGEEPLQSQQVYTIQVAPTTKSIYGDGFSGEHIFTFTTERLDLLDIAAGEDFKKQNRAFYFKDADVPPAAARFITLIFNYPVQAADMREFVTVTDGAETFDFTLKNLTETKLLAELKKEPAFQRTITVTLQRGAKSKTATRGTESPVSKTFSTPDGFSVKNIGRQSGYGRYINLVDFEFSYPLNESTVSPAAIQTKPKMQITAENIEVWGNTVRLFNLPVSYGDKFTVTMLPVVKDRYGRLLDGEYSQQITVPEEPPPSGSVRFLNEWDSMAILEAQFPPRYLFEYKNIAKDSWYSISKMSNPFSKQAADTKFVELETGKKNAKYFADIDLKPFLVDGKGFILFEADINLLPKLEKKQDNGRYYRYEKDFTAIQVTDLGLSVRYAFNKAAVLVTSLSTGTPVSGAEVKLFGMESKADYANIKDAPLIGAAVSGEDGLAVINAPGLVIRNLIARRGEIAVYAKKGVDRVVFTPDSHNTWRYNIYTGFISDAEEITPVVFLFSDRGLYKPGETLTFRGVDRSKVLGQYAVYTGDFLVQLEEDSYGGKVIAEITGETSDSGGFWGRLAVPETLKPGAYRLSYRRGAGKSLATSPVTVAFFERLKFEANISGPPVAVISGSDINASLNASYLSGGSLSGAEYDVNWYRDISFYHPNTAETRGFAFGPGKSGDGRRFVAGSEGMMLSGDGSAKLTQKTGDEPVKGAPYLYTASALVRDLSNQQIAAETSVLVHPALFYIGARRQSKGGFAKAGSEAAFDYVTVGVNGEKTTGASLFLRTGPEAGVITAALYREEWRRVQQAGVNGYVYNEYIREQVEDSAQKIKIENGGGSFKFKPSASGYHILRLTAEDRDGKTALTEIGFYVTGGKGGYWNSGYADEIRLVPDRNK